MTTLTRPRAASRAAVALGRVRRRPRRRSGCSSSGGAPAAARRSILVAYSVPKPAYDALEAAFAKTERRARASSSRRPTAPSGTQSKAVAAGQKADYVAFSLEPDMTKLVPDVRRRRTGTRARPRASSSDSVVVIAVRKGNPKHITGWDDLIKPGVKIVTPDPASSGSAKWNILAAYDARARRTAAPTAQAQAYLTKFFKQRRGQARRAARTRRRRSLGGTGDVLISYENEAIAARQKGADARLHRPERDDADREPGRRHHEGARRRRRTSSRSSRATPARRSSPSKGFRPVVAGRRRPARCRARTTRQPVPDGQEADDDRRARRLDAVNNEVLRRRQRHRHQDREQVRRDRLATRGNGRGTAPRRTPRSAAARRAEPCACGAASASGSAWRCSG